MQLISVNIGQVRVLRNGKQDERTGIFKIPTHEPVQINTLGMQGDFISDTHNHGGPDQAIYIYGLPDYDWWSKELGREMPPGIFGDNLTVSDLESATFSIGDRLYFAGVVLQVSAPRIPCATLAARMGDPKFVKRYRQAVRPGLYCRVIQPGLIQVGEALRVEPYPGETISVAEMFSDFYERDKSEETLRRHLRAPISIRSRLDMEQELQERFPQE